MNQTRPRAELPADRGAYAQWQGAVALRLFADRDEPTLTVPEQVAARVGDRILAGTLAPGERVLEQDLATEFKVSRGPVREAIRILEREGLVTVLPRRGAVVTDLTAEEVREIFEVRIALWAVAGRRCAQVRDPAVTGLFRATVAELERLAALDDDQGRYAEAVYQLWMMLARASGNRRLSRILSAVSLQTLRYSKLGVASRDRRQRSVKGWREALRALVRGDTEGFVAATSRLMLESGEEAARLLEEAAGNGPSPQATRSTGTSR